eukprot:SAG31_NODE_2584_length_5434_cov_3.784067_2_plen_219_part_00
MARPFGAGVQPDGRPDQVTLDDVIMWDSWKFSLCDDACTLHRGLINKTVRNGAPARVTRGGLPLPTVTLDAVSSGVDTRLLPFAIATRYPKGPAVLLTSLGRTTTAGFVEPEAHFKLFVPLSHSGKLPVIGLFGRFRSVTLQFPGGAWQFALSERTSAVSARDMLAPTSSACNLSRPEAEWLNQTTLWLNGTVLAHIGSRAKSRPDDVSTPGVVLQLA